MSISTIVARVAVASVPYTNIVYLAVWVNSVSVFFGIPYAKPAGLFKGTISVVQLVAWISNTFIIMSSNRCASYFYRFCGIDARVADEGSTSICATSLASLSIIES
jgi:hypothetical protein